MEQLAVYNLSNDNIIKWHTQ